MSRSAREIEEDRARRILGELARRAEGAAKIDFGKLSFGPQRVFVEDQSRFLAAICGRRAGKTDGMALKALRVAHTIPHCQVPYITLSRPSAKRIIWPKLQHWNRALNLGAKFNHVDLAMILKNGSQILLGGANDESEIERYRGGAYPLVIIDEAQAFRGFLKQLVEEILAPATLDYAGQIAMIGTPNPSCMGYFYEATVGLIQNDDGGPVWNTHRWTAFDNPHLTRKDRFGNVLATPYEQVHELRQLSGLSEDDPRFRREWLGEWIRNEDGLVYAIPDRALVDRLPEGTWDYVLGIDVGYVDATAFVVLAFDSVRTEIVVVESYQRTEMIPSAVAAEVERLNQRYDFLSIVVDPGGGGKAYVEEMKQRWQIPAKVARKREKAAAIELLNGDVRCGIVKVVAHANEDLLHDARLLQWDYSKHKGTQFGGRFSKEILKISQRTPDHLLDAMLYGYREVRALYEPEMEDPSPGSPEAMAAEEQEMLDRARGRARGDQGAWWERGFPQ